MSSTFKKTEEFHRTAGHPCDRSPGWPNKDELFLGMSLIEEEFKELKQAIDARDLLGVADALGDLDVVINGMGLRMGFNMEAISDIVHESNMSKFCTNIESAIDSQELYLKKGIATQIENHNGLWVIYRKSDGKILKSINFKEPNLQGVIS